MEKEKSEYNILFGKKMKHLRQERDLSQAQLAKVCGINRTYVGALERGEKGATVNTIYKLAEGLGVSPSEFFE